ncbi:hypothetical protein FIBSPDRAFT_1038526 [Athelia psychrophila]|uniref:PIH1 N-terminal domain-containing protein n=1 Tax=Athelia psychrophila TaxID=1759441 RepID=A0A166T549_9AGAM|nr:hypothetical protein FIBSPDRAFT_1038526 [Fibularhizoctonia sp. CBS 109695]
MSSGFNTVELKPTPGFVVKSAQLPPLSSPAPLQLHLRPATRTSSSQPTQQTGLPLSAGLKVFINIAWDAHVPPPPAGSEDSIQRAMLSMDEDKHDTAQPKEGGSYVPVVVSAPREDTDKKGAKALVFDAVFHTSVKGRATRDEAFKVALFAAASSAAPNAPDALNITGTGTGAARKAKGKKLIEEVEVEGPPNSKGVLKGGGAKNGSAKAKAETNVKGILKPAPKGRGTDDPAVELGEVGDADQDHHRRPAARKPLLSLFNPPHNPRDQCTHAHIPSAALDLEPRRILLAIPGPYALDVPLDVPDAELVTVSAQLDSDGTTTVTAGGASWETGALGLKRARDLDVEGARAEWRVEEGC